MSVDMVYNTVPQLYNLLVSPDLARLNTSNPPQSSRKKLWRRSFKTDLQETVGVPWSSPRSLRTLGKAGLEIDTSLPQDTRGRIGKLRLGIGKYFGVFHELEVVII